MKSCGAPSTRACRWLIGRVSRPTRPMSWYSGSHDTSTSSSGSSDVAWAMASRLAPTVRCGSITPFGSDGRPAGELQDRQPVGVVGGTLPRVGAGAARARLHGVQLDHRRVAGSRLDERGQVGVDEHQRDVGVGDAHAGLVRRTPRSTTAASAAAARRRSPPLSQIAWMAVTSGRVVGPRRATWSPGPTPSAWRLAA